MLTTSQKHDKLTEKRGKGKNAMNHYIYAQILNMQAMAKTFEQSCELAATKDDGKISKDEAKQLKRIRAAVETFCKELDKVKN